MTVAVAAECIWTRRPLGLDVVRELEAAVARAPGFAAGGMRLGLFSTGRFTSAVEKWAKEKNAMLVDAEGLIK